MYNNTAGMLQGHCGPDRMVVGFTTIYAITNVVSSNPVHCEVYYLPHCVIEFVSDS